jgi:serine/threonine protein kinase
LKLNFFFDSGYYEVPGVPAAVKRIKKSNNDQLSINEIETLQKLNHPNVVRYFATAKVNGVFYISMGKADRNLWEFKQSNPKDTDILIKLLHDTCLGLQCLHNHRIVHRDVNPNNILVMQTNRGFVGKLSDFGLSKIVPQDKNHWVSSPCGTHDFLPPEVLIALSTKKTTIYCSGTDIYSMGVTMFYILSQENCPVGVELDVPERVLDFKEWKSANPPVVQLQSCIPWMTCHNVQRRPSINFVLTHPWNWSPKKNLDFIEATYQYLESGTSDAKNDREKLKRKLLTDLKIYEVSPAEGWKGNLCRGVRNYVENPPSSKEYPNPKTYDDPKDYLKLIEFIRDKDQHFTGLPTELRLEIFGNEPDTYIKYFTERFPGLIPAIFIFLQCRKDAPRLRYFYEESKS